MKSLFIRIRSVITENIVLISRAFRRQLVIPQFEEFTDTIAKFYSTCKNIEGGQVRSRHVDFMNDAVYNKSFNLHLTGSLLYSSAGAHEPKLLGR